MESAINSLKSYRLKCVYFCNNCFSFNRKWKFSLNQKMLLCRTWIEVECSSISCCIMFTRAHVFEQCTMEWKCLSVFRISVYTIVDNTLGFLLSQFLFSIIISINTVWGVLAWHTHVRDIAQMDVSNIHIWSCMRLRREISERKKNRKSRRLLQYSHCLCRIKWFRFHSCQQTMMTLCANVCIEYFVVSREIRFISIQRYTGERDEQMSVCVSSWLNTFKR